MDEIAKISFRFGCAEVQAVKKLRVPGRCSMRGPSFGDTRGGKYVERCGARAYKENNSYAVRRHGLKLRAELSQQAVSWSVHDRARTSY